MINIRQDTPKVYPLRTARELTREEEDEKAANGHDIVSKKPVKFSNGTSGWLYLFRRLGPEIENRSRAS
jgi:hypothetical protein